MVLTPESDTGSSMRPTFSNALVVVDQDSDEVVISPTAQRRRSRRREPNPPGSTMSTPKSLESLIGRFDIPRGVELVLPRSDGRADHPPEGYFTLYEAYFHACFMWFPIPGAILNFLWRTNLAIAQITPRGMRHLIGIMVRGYECDSEVGVDHLLSFLKVNKTGSKGKRCYFLKEKPDFQIIVDLPSRDLFWAEKFLFVKINEASVGCGYLDRIRKRWGTRVLSRISKLPEDLFDLCAALAAEKCSWEKDFSLPRVKEALARRFGITSLNSSSEMSDNMKKPSARERRAMEAGKESNTRVLEQARPSVLVPRAGTTATPAPKPRHPALERNVTTAVERRSESSQRRHDEARRRDDGVEASRKRPREDKDRGAGDGDDQNRSKHNSNPRRDRAGTTSTIPFGDAATAASHLSKIVSPGTVFPPPGDMSKEDSYATAALHCMTFLSSFNKLAIDYEVTLRSKNRQISNVQEACDNHKKQKRDAEDRIATLEAAMKEIEDRRREMDGTFTESESERKRLQKEVSDLTTRLDVAAKLQDAAVQRAVDEAKRELAAQYEARIVSAGEKIGAINGQPRIDIIDLAEVRSNIEFVKLLQSDKAPDLGEELVALKEQEAGLALADKVFADHVCELKEILKPSPISTVDGRTNELDAASSLSSSDSSSDDDSSDPAAEGHSEQDVEIVDDAEETAS